MLQEQNCTQLEVVKSAATGEYYKGEYQRFSAKSSQVNEIFWIKDFPQRANYELNYNKLYGVK